MGSTLKIQMNRFNGTDYDVMLPQAIAVQLNTPRKIGNANFDGTSNITLEQIGVYSKSEVDTAISTAISTAITSAIGGGY